MIELQNTSLLDSGLFNWPSDHLTFLASDAWDIYMDLVL